MAKKLRPFFDPARDDAIRKAGPEFDLSDLKHVNHTELVQLCWLINPEGGAHMGMSRNTLEEIIVGVIPEDNTNPVDKCRSKLRAFITANWDKIHDQLEVNCTGDCFKCHDFKVLGCFVTNADHLRNEPSEG